MIDYYYDFIWFISQIFDSIFQFIFDNKTVLLCFFVPVVTTCILIVIDFIFDIRDNFTDFNHFKDDFYYKYKYRYSKRKKQNELNMNEVYRRSKENADYKHELRMKELKYYRENEELRHNNKHEEKDMYINSYSIPKHSNKKKVNLDIEVEDE